MGNAELADKVAVAIERLKVAAKMSEQLFHKPLLVAYSGGKDSDCLLKLAEIAKIKFEAQHSLTTADAPETVRHVYDTFKRLELDGVKCDVDKHIKPDGCRVTMWNLIPEKLIPPTRLFRYCCEALKEGGGRDRLVATGVRWAESVARKKNRGSLEVISKKRETNLILLNDNEESRRLFETCQMKGKRVVNPIIDWTDTDVLDFCRTDGVKLNPLYKAFRRVGCVGCPMAGGKQQMAQFARWPKIKAAYLRAFDKMLCERRKRGLPCDWADAREVMHWWLNDGVLPGQEVIGGFEE